MGRQGAKETQIAVFKQKAHWEGNSGFPHAALAYREIKSQLICSAPIPLCRSDVNARCCFSRTMSLPSIMFSSHQISLLKEALLLESCLLQLSLLSSRYCNRGFCLKQLFFAPYTFMHTSPKPLRSFHFQTAQIVSPLIKLTFMSLFTIFHV